MIQDASLALTLQQVLIAIWTIGSVVMIPLVRALTNTLAKLDRTTSELSAIVVGLPGGQESLVQQVKRLEKEAEDDREIIRFIVAKIRAARSIEDLHELEIIPRRK